MNPKQQRLNTDCHQTMISNGVSPDIGIGRAKGDGETIMTHGGATGTFH